MGLVGWIVDRPLRKTLTELEKALRNEAQITLKEKIDLEKALYAIIRNYNFASGPFRVNYGVYDRAERVLSDVRSKPVVLFKLARV